MRSFLSGVACIVVLLAADQAHACGGGLEPSRRWALDHTEYSGNNGLPFLSPGNDSRINLQLLMRDAYPRQVSKAGSIFEADTKIDFNSPVLFSRSDIETAFNADANASPPERGSVVGGKPVTFADGEGTRCISFEGGKLAFIAAVQAESGLSAAERNVLVEARNRTTVCLNMGTGDHSQKDPLAGISEPSVAAREFAEYLAGANAFYGGAFDQAIDHFQKIVKAQDGWLRETARYMIGRTLLNKAQVGAFASLDGVAEPKVTDRTSLGASEAELKLYLADYPAGRYAASARGLLRRIYWLGGDKTRLAAEYGWQITHCNSLQANLGNSVLAQEIDSKYLGAAAGESHDPNLIAVEDLMRLRSSDPVRPKFPAAELEAQAPDFVGHEEMFAFLKAARAYYADGDFVETLQLLSPASPGPLSPPYLAFSRETLRGQALMASGRFEAAILHWKTLLPLAAEPWQREAVELGLGMSWERAGTLNKVFLPETRIASPRIRALLLRHSAGPILLRMAVADPQSRADERKLARFVLLFKEATRGQYAGFLRDYSPDGLTGDDAQAPQVDYLKSSAFLWEGSSEPYQCPALKAVIGELAANPGSSHGLLCLGEFIRTEYLDDFESNPPAPDELGGGKPIFPGQAFSRGEIYKKLINSPSTPDIDRAYALYRAVRCYEPSGVNGCGGKDVELAQRKAWHTMLKSRYGATAWARSLKYYW